MNKIMAKITSLFSEKKVKIVAGVLTVALITGGAVVISNVASADEAWTAFLSFFGKANVTGNVWQSVLLDGGRYNAGDDTRTQSYTTSDIFAGETTRSYHELENRSSVQQKVHLATSYSPGSIADYITTTYWKVLGYNETIEIDTQKYSLPATITVEDKGSEVKWTIDMDETTGPFSNGHAAYALVISHDKAEPAYQIHSNDGTDSTYAWGTHLYSEWGPAGTGYNGWHTSDTNILVSSLDWVSASGKRDLTDNPNLVYTVTIDKSKLGNEFYWALQLMGNTSDTQYPDTWAKWSGDASGLATATLEERIWDGNVTLQPNETIDFVMSNETANNLVCKGCTVTVTVEPR